MGVAERGDHHGEPWRLDGTRYEPDRDDDGLLLEALRASGSGPLVTNRRQRGK
jgi:hypothetical protein